MNIIVPLVGIIHADGSGIRLRPVEGWMRKGIDWKMLRMDIEAGTADLELAVPIKPGESQAEYELRKGALMIEVELAVVGKTNLQLREADAVHRGTTEIPVLIRE